MCPLVHFVIGSMSFESVRDMFLPVEFVFVCHVLIVYVSCGLLCCLYLCIFVVLVCYCFVALFVIRGVILCVRMLSILFVVILSLL